MANIRKKGDSYEVRIHRTNIAEPVKLSKSFKSKKEASAWAASVEAKIASGEKVSRKAETLTFGDACAAFLEHYRPKGPKSGGKISERETQLVAAINVWLSDKKIAQMTHGVLQDFVDRMLVTPITKPVERKKKHPYYNGDRERTYSASTVRHHYFQIKKVMEWHSIREKYALDQNLFRGHHIPAAWQGQRERRLQSGEIEAIEAAAKTARSYGNEWILLTRFALATAARAQEILKAKWSDVNMPGKAWNIPPENVKTSTFRQVPISRDAFSVLAELDKLRSDSDPRLFHFWQDSTTISKGWRRLTSRAGVEDLRFHDLRHEAVSRLFESTRLSDVEIMSITGHTNIATLRGYAKLRPNYLADKIDAGLSFGQAPQKA